MTRIAGNISNSTKQFRFVPKSQILTPNRMNVFQYFHLRFEMERNIFLTGNKQEMARNKPEKSEGSSMLCVILYQKTQYNKLNTSSLMHFHICRT